LKKVAISQSNYIPWKGYFDIINRVDEFIIYDSVQYTKRDWRNRNQIKTPAGSKWLTIPVHQKTQFSQAIKEVMVSDPKWSDRHWNTIRRNYSKAPHFKNYSEHFAVMYENCRHEKYLSNINYLFLTGIIKILEIDTKLSWVMDHPSCDGNATQRLLQVCHAVGATHYLSGPSAKNYVNEEDFRQAGISLEYMDYSKYSEYEQLYPPFTHNVSILDLIFACGADAPAYIWDQ